MFAIESVATSKAESLFIMADRVRLRCSALSSPQRVDLKVRKRACEQYDAIRRFLLRPFARKCSGWARSGAGSHTRTAYECLPALPFSPQHPAARKMELTSGASPFKGMVSCGRASVTASSMPNGGILNQPYCLPIDRQHGPLVHSRHFAGALTETAGISRPNSSQSFASGNGRLYQPL